MSKRLLLFGGGALAVAGLAVAAVVAIQLLRSDDPNLATEAPLIEATTAGDSADSSHSGPASGDAAEVPEGVRRFVIVPEQSSAKYVVRETLRGLETNAVGTTSAIDGEIYLTADGLYEGEASHFKVDLRTLKSDEGMRDNYIKQNTLQTGRYPDAVFVLTGVEGFPADYVENTQVEVSLSGRLTVHGVEKDVTWTVLARQAGDTLTATADTDILFSDFGMSPPNVQVAKAKDGIHLQLVLVAREEA